uniref:peptidylprolyl isomerase n=1 Tax=Oryza punctata TaxID=4537 RepID=A0A0E0JK71_ORYPU
MLLIENVMRGFSIAVSSMQAGEKAVFTIPPELAGTKSRCPADIPGNIAPNKALRFDIELISLNYNACLEDGVSVSMSEGVEFNLAEGFFCPACARAAETMTEGEEAILIVKPEYGFGERGRPSIGDEAGVPPDATLYVYLQLMSWKTVRHIGENGTILKKTLRRGNLEGQQTENEAVVGVRLIVKLQGGAVFDQRGHEGDEPFKFMVDEEQVSEGLEEAVLAMREGEVSLFTIPPHRVQDQLLVVPAGSSMTYEIELVSVVNDKHPRLMSRSETIEAAAEKEKEGDKLFSSSKFLRAYRIYYKVLEYDPGNVKAREMTGRAFSEASLGIDSAAMHRGLDQGIVVVVDLGALFCCALFASSRRAQVVVDLLLDLQILYLDSLSFKNLNVPVEGYRATVWTNELINQAILADTSADGSFGALPEKDKIVIAVQNLCEGFSEVTSSDDEDFVADEDEMEDTEEDEYTDEDGDSDDDEDEREEDDDDEGEEDDDEDRSENDDNDDAKTARSGEQPDAATDVTGCKGDDTNKGVCSGGKGADDVIGKGKQVDEGIGFGDKEKHEEKQAPNAAAQNVPESEKQPVEKAENYPFLTTSIDSHKVPNFKSSQEVVQTPKGQEAAGTSRGKEFPIIITNEDYGSFTTEDYEKVGREADDVIANKSATKSPVAEVISKEAITVDCEVEEETPVPHEYNKRVVKPAKFKRSPLIDYENKKQFVVSRVINEGYLLDSQLDRNELKKHFDQTKANRLDHKELAFFPILQELGNGNDKAGHYFVVCLNLKAERFEVYDSLRGEDDEELISAINLVVASIKTMWDRVYMRSSKKTIQNYPLIFIDGPKQDNMYPFGPKEEFRVCGYIVPEFSEMRLKQGNKYHESRNIFVPPIPTPETNANQAVPGFQLLLQVTGSHTSTTPPGPNNEKRNSSSRVPVAARKGLASCFRCISSASN